jgi:hypothetical protein
MNGLDKLAEIIDRHEYDVNLATGLPRPACACGWITDGEWGSTFVHSEHVAAAITAHLAGVITNAMAVAWDEGYRLDWTGGVRWENPYAAERGDA